MTTRNSPLGAARAPYDLVGMTDEIIDAGFEPADDLPESEGMDWILDFGLYAYRIEANGSVTTVTDSDQTLILTNSSRNYLINAEARFDSTREGAAWFAAALNVRPS